MGPAALAQVLRPLSAAFPAAAHPELLVGLEGPDDAAVYKLNDEQAVVQTVDFFSPVVDDPYIFGAVAAVNAMSDIWAMGGEVAFALNIAGFPEDVPASLITEIFRGGADKAAEAGVVIAGGHTVTDDEPKYGLVVTGLIRPERILTKAGVQPGDRLFVTGDHGTDPTLRSTTDHTREFVPVVVWGPDLARPGALGTRTSMADLGATVLDLFGLDRSRVAGTSFADRLG